MRRFKGFTLTELMVALAVIGVLVAVVTPAIMRTRPNKNKMMVKKSFYAVEQIVSSLVNDEQLYPDMREACELNQDNGDNIYCAWGFDYVYPVNFEGAEYAGDYKFAALFKERLNVSKDSSEDKADGAGPDDEDFYPVFYTNDGIKWDLTGTANAWESEQQKVGTFDNQTDAAGIGKIIIDVNGDEEPNAFCTADNEDCDKYEIEILASGKMRINPEHVRAIDWVTINTSIKDSL